MTLYELTDSMMIQGNVCIKVFDSNDDEERNLIFTNLDYLTANDARLHRLTDLEVTYIYASYEYGGAWLNIELQTE